MPRRKSRKNPTYAVTYHIGGGRFQTVTLDAANEYEATIEAKEMLSPFAVGIPDVREVRRSRKNPSAARAKAQRWAMPRNAGPYLPEMYPYGVGGVPASYAVGNPSAAAVRLGLKRSLPVLRQRPDPRKVEEAYRRIRDRLPQARRYSEQYEILDRYGMEPPYGDLHELCATVDEEREEAAYLLAEQVVAGLTSEEDAIGLVSRYLGELEHASGSPRHGRTWRLFRNPEGPYSDVLDRYGPDGFGIPEKAPFVGSFPLYPISRARYALAIIGSPFWDERPEERDQIAKAVLRAWPELEGQYLRMLEGTVRERRTRAYQLRFFLSSRSRFIRPEDYIEKDEAKNNPPRDSKGRYISTRRARKNSVRWEDMAEVSRVFRKLKGHRFPDPIARKIYRLAEQVVAGKITEAQAYVSVRSLLDKHKGPIRLKGRANNNPRRDSKGRFVKRRRARKNTTGIDQRKVARMYRKLMEDPDLDDRKIEKKIYRLAEQVVAGQITEAQARLSVRSLLTDYYVGPIPDPMQDMRLVRIGGRGRNYRPRYAKDNPRQADVGQRYVIRTIWGKAPVFVLPRGADPRTAIGSALWDSLSRYGEPASPVPPGFRAFATQESGIILSDGKTVVESYGGPVRASLQEWQQEKGDVVLGPETHVSLDQARRILAGGETGLPGVEVGEGRLEFVPQWMYMNPRQPRDSKGRFVKRRRR